MKFLCFTGALIVGA
jgi:hypothetical protein